MAMPTSSTTETTLRDGTPVLIRPLQASDREALVEGFKQLSARSRYLRFHTYVDHLTEAQIDYLMDVDGKDHVAWAAVRPDLPGQPGMGVARYIRLKDQPAIAEAAVTVLDEYQGKGLGTLLLAHLERSARENGIKVFRNYVLQDNDQMLAIFADLGAVPVPDAPGVYRIDMPIPPEPDEHPDTPAGRVLSWVGRMEDDAPPLLLPLDWARKALGLDDDGRGRSRLLKGHHHDDDGEAAASPPSSS